MPNWSEILDEVKSAGSTHDVVRRKYLARLHDLTGRNILIYYSAWLQKEVAGTGAPNLFGISDSDKNGFMAAIHELDRSKGLDLLLHTPGGQTAATESLVEYLRAMFGTNIRAVVPQIAMSGGTMIALAAREIVMGKHSSLGPIDPQFGPIPAHGLIEEFEEAQKQIAAHGQLAAMLWQPILAKYPPTLVGEARKAIKWSQSLARDWLKSGMLDGDPDADAKIDRIITGLTDSALTLSHSRHVSIASAQALGLNVTALEDDQDLQDAVLTVHHCAVQTMADHSAFKIIENHRGVAFIQSFRQQQ